jgi:hypothetical protein
MPRQSSSIPHINNTAIRNTTTITTTAYNLDEFERAALFVNNTLDQIVNIVAEYSRDNATFIPVGTALSVPAAIGGKAYNALDIEALKLINGWIRFKATAAVTPTIGNLTVIFQRDGQ